MAMAVRFEPLVCRMVMELSGYDLINTNIFNMEDVGAGLAVEWTEYDDRFVDPFSAALFAPAGGRFATTDETKAIVANYEDTKHRLYELDTNGRLEGFQIPLTLSFENSDNDLFLDQVCDLLAAIVATTNVQTLNGSRCTSAVYRLVGVEVGDCRGSVASVANIEALGIDTLVCGIQAGNITADQAMIEALLQPGPTKPPVVLEITASSQATPRLLDTALRLGSRLKVLEVDVEAGGTVNWDGIAQLLLIPGRPGHILRRLKLKFEQLQLTSDTLTTLERALATSRSSQHDVTRGSLLETFIFRADNTTERWTRRFIPILTQCLPSSLKTMMLQVSDMDAECLRLLLHGFPHLEILALDVERCLTPSAAETAASVG